MKLVLSKQEEKKQMKTSAWIFIYIWNKVEIDRCLRTSNTKKLDNDWRVYKESSKYNISYIIEKPTEEERDNNFVNKFRFEWFCLLCILSLEKETRKWLKYLLTTEKNYGRFRHIARNYQNFIQIN